MEIKLGWYSETKEENGIEEQVFFLKYSDDPPINLSSKIPVGINDIEEIFNDDLVFISDDHDDLIGIYSFKQGKIIFPFIISAFDTNNDSDYIYLELKKGKLAQEKTLELELNPNNDFAYLYPNGGVFQNEGIIFEKIGKHHYILKDELLGADFIGESWSYKIYSNLFETEDSIDYRGIWSYDYDKTKGEVRLEFKEGKNNVYEITIKI